MSPGAAMLLRLRPVGVPIVMQVAIRSTHHRALEQVGGRADLEQLGARICGLRSLYGSLRPGIGGQVGFSHLMLSYCCKSDLTPTYPFVDSVESRKHAIPDLHLTCSDVHSPLAAGAIGDKRLGTVVAQRATRLRPGPRGGGFAEKPFSAAATDLSTLAAGDGPSCPAYLQRRRRTACRKPCSGPGERDSTT